MKTILWTATLFLFSVIQIMAQSFCVTPGNYPNNLNYSTSSFNPSAPAYTVRIVVHIIRRTDGTGGMTASQLTNALNILASDFQNHNICFSLKNIDYINSDNFYNTSWDSQFNSIIATNPSIDAIDIYMFPETNSGGGQASGIPANALVIGGNLNFNGIITYSANSHILSHEMGHCLGLFHTFHGTCCEPGCPELVNGSNGTTCGDFVQDSPADPVRLFNYSLNNCTWNNTSFRDANNDLYNPDEKIIMAYTYPQCMQYFTNGQGQRMRDQMANSPILTVRSVPYDLKLQNRTFSSGDLLYATSGTISTGKNIDPNQSTGNFIASGSTKIILKAGHSINISNGTEFNPNISGSMSLQVIADLCSIIDRNNSARPGYLVEEESKLSEERHFGIYPNPNLGSFTINFPSISSNYQIEVIDMLENIVHKESVSEISSKEFNLTAVSSGIYLIKVSGDGKIFTEKVQIIK